MSGHQKIKKEDPGEEGETAECSTLDLMGLLTGQVAVQEVSVPRDPSISEVQTMKGARHVKKEAPQEDLYGDLEKFSSGDTHNRTPSKQEIANLAKHDSGGQRQVPKAALKRKAPEVAGSLESVLFDRGDEISLEELKKKVDVVESTRKKMRKTLVALRKKATALDASNAILSANTERLYDEAQRQVKERVAIITQLRGTQ